MFGRNSQLEESWLQGGLALKRGLKTGVQHMKLEKSVIYVMLLS